MKPTLKYLNALVEMLFSEIAFASSRLQSQVAHLHEQRLALTNAKECAEQSRVDVVFANRTGDTAKIRAAEAQADRDQRTVEGFVSLVSGLDSELYRLREELDEKQTRLVLALSRRDQAELEADE